MKSNVGISFTNRQALFIPSNEIRIKCLNNTVSFPWSKYSIMIEKIVTLNSIIDEYVVVSTIPRPQNSCVSDVYLASIFSDKNIRVFSPLVEIKLIFEGTTTLTISNDFPNAVLYCFVKEA